MVNTKNDEESTTSDDGYDYYTEDGQLYREKSGFPDTREKVGSPTTNKKADKTPKKEPKTPPEQTAIVTSGKMPDINLLPGEKIEFYLPKVGYSYSNIGSIGMSTLDKELIVTNKRILLSYTWLVAQSFVNAFNFYYNKTYFEQYKKLGNNWPIDSYELGDNSIKLHYRYMLLSTTAVIYTPYNKKIAAIIDANKGA